MNKEVLFFIQQLIDGLRLGSIYALVALGYTMVYGIIRLINFAHGDFIMIGGYSLLFSIPLMKYIGAPLWMGVIIAVIICILVGVTVELIAYRPIRKASSISALITAISVSLFIQNFALLKIGGTPIMLPALFRIPKFKFDTKATEVFFNRNSVALLTIIICFLTMILLTTFVKKTKVGKAMRAVSEDPQAAVLMGINVNRTITKTFALGSALAAVAALMYCNTFPQLTPFLGGMLGLKAFVAAVLGGIGIIPGAMLGGLIIGLVETMSKAYISSSYADAVVFGILIVVLLVKPAGILGKNVGEKV